MQNGKLISVVKNSFTLALSSWQGAVIKNFHFGTDQNMLANVLGNTLGYSFIMFDIVAWSPLHPEDHVIATVLSAFKVDLEFTADFRYL